MDMTKIDLDQLVDDLIFCGVLADAPSRRLAALLLLGWPSNSVSQSELETEWANTSDSGTDLHRSLAYLERFHFVEWKQGERIRVLGVTRNDVQDYFDRLPFKVCAVTDDSLRGVKRVRAYAAISDERGSGCTK